MLISPDTKRKNRIPPGQILTDKWPVLHEGKAPFIDISNWKLRIWGLVENELQLSFADFNTLSRVKVFSDMHCVTTWSRLDNLWEGVSTSTLKDLVNIKPEAGFVVVHADVNFTTNLTLEDFFAEDVLFALKHDDKPISVEHGGPVRLLVPRLYLWKSAKWVTGIEFTKENRPGFWETRGYHNHGDPWLEERFS